MLGYVCTLVQAGVQSSIGSISYTRTWFCNTHNAYIHYIPPTHRCNVVKLVACDWLIVSGLLVKRVFVFHVVIDLRTQYWFVAGNDNNNNNIFLINVIAPTTIETKDKSLKLQTVYI